MMNIIRIAVLIATLAMLQTAAAAHDFSTSYSRVTIDGTNVEVHLTLNLHDFHTEDLGFGFSNVLKEMALSRRTLAVGLFSFNGGVELGQLGFVCIVFPIVLYLSTSRWKPQFLSGSSAAIAALGFFWFIQRCFLAG